MRTINDYATLFLTDTPCIDTRSPGEFAKGHFPNATNLPLLNDAERAQVGTCYKQRGQQAAIELGHQLVSGNLKTQRVDDWVKFCNQHQNNVLFCWRGGLRSKTCQEWLADAGVECPRVEGGYKAMRRFLLNFNENLNTTGRYILIAGHTGSAKTELLKKLLNSVDLEGLAHHRGSAFGKRLGGQPSQTSFENSLFIDLLKAATHNPEHAIVLEDESHLIGRCALPLTLHTAMKSAPLVVVETTLQQRIEHSFNNYILDNLAECEATLGREEGFVYFANDLRQSFDNIRKRLGSERHQKLRETLEKALQAHRLGDNSLHLHWIEPLLRDYYDPMYNYQIEKKRDRVLFRGDPEAVLEFLKNYQA
ncbi:tRNA 2-selenouridine synthase [Alteromonadaceae bacterium 2753L.S.0a.02]|nr:tRNA 2-selenouridine synthase [Alteromonadaceae bacterium 2753L.S.0a.02]